MFKYSGMTQKDTEVLNEALLEALRSGPMTQTELTQEIASKVGKNVRRWMELAWSIQIFRLALIEGLICYGAERGKKMTFVRVDQWLPRLRKVDEQEAKQILLRRYLSAYGPATPQDFSKWSGIPMVEAREIWESLDGEVIEVSIEDKKGSILSEDYEPFRHSDLGKPSLRLLPSFDPYLLGHAEKSHLVSEAHYKSVYRNQGWISPAVLLNGRVIGIWSNKREEHRSSLTIELFEKLSKTLRTKIEGEVAGLEDFLGTSFEIRFSKRNRGG